MKNEQLKAGEKAGTKVIINIVRWILIIIVLLIFLFPVYWIISGSFKTLGEFYTRPPSIVPARLMLDNFKNALSVRGTKGLIDSAIISITVTIITMIISVPASYSIARYRPGGMHISFFILSILFLPPVIGVIPLFFIFKTLKMLDTYYVFFLSYMFFGLPFCIWIMKGFFEDIPVELEQAAMVDGHSRFKVFFKIAIPLARAGIAVAGLFAFIFAWNELMFASIFGRYNVQTLPLALQDYIGSTGVAWGELSALATIAAIPGILLAVFMQRYIVRGLTFGAVKG
ncbi:MAG: carbohydrate ABC transporter permease [Spirochaetes bacterium]|nr:carbohydrate ABC transporter permease [Spirochaetota bacterium]